MFTMTLPLSSPPVLALAATRHGLTDRPDTVRRAAALLESPPPSCGPIAFPVDELRSWYRLALTYIDPEVVETAARVLEREWELDYAPAVFLCLELVFIAVTPVPGDPPEARREFILRADAAGCTDNSLAHLLGITPASVRVARSRANKPRVVKRPAVSSLMGPLYAKFPDVPPLVIDAVIAAYRSAHRALRKK